ncbi:Hypothetical protein, putative [Bodo saltans]|uniref:Uncharacterized protein n=1 Tax=Bodo saltans TaxID=75058 RepID=A0A0S4JQQ5_BODSA|nr:Hypothetical protein, putative [Bodo saltans]|eukprot:CUG93858.1 Hypothetical protein, putative [Bodo saltans]
MASGREPRIYRTFDLHARLQSQQQPPLLRITCAAVTTVPGVDPHVDGDAG